MLSSLAFSQRYQHTFRIRGSSLMGGDPGFKQTGLKKASVIKIEKIAVVHQSLIRKELDRLSPELLQKVKQILGRTLRIE
jgi:hypothetical protein